MAGRKKVLLKVIILGMKFEYQEMIFSEIKDFVLNR
jgi:hypothetical protein